MDIDIRTNDIRAIDPIVFVLHGKWLDLYWLIHHPHVPSTEAIREAIKGATAEERRSMLARAKVLKESATAMEAAIEKVGTREA